MKTERLVVIGKILRPHGVRGDVKVEIITDDPEYFFDIDDVYISERHDSPANIPAKIENARMHKEAVLVKFDIINTPEEVEKYRGFYILIPESELYDLEEDEYYVNDLLGIEVFTVDGAGIGSISNVIPGGVQDIYEIKNPESGKVNMIPARKEFIKSIDLENRKMIVEVIEGLIE